MNRRPLPYEGNALPTELHQHFVTRIVTEGEYIFNYKSERRDSNPRHSPWEGDILPIELLSQLVDFSIKQDLFQS